MRHCMTVYLLNIIGRFLNIVFPLVIFIFGFLQITMNVQVCRALMEEHVLMGRTHSYVNVCQVSRESTARQVITFLKIFMILLIDSE